MSHFTVVVCTDNPDRLNTIMAPWDENTQVKPYRSYEKEAAADWWLYKSLKRTAEEVANDDHSSIKPYKPDEFGISSSWSKKTAGDQWAELLADAETFRSLPDPITWEALVKMHNERYDDDVERMFYEAETDRAYTMSTYNPLSKWDYWRIGGRWGGYFLYKEGFRHKVQEWLPERNWDSPKEWPQRGCDGGQKRYLDLEGTKEYQALKVSDRYREYHKLVDHLPEATAWSWFRDEAKAERMSWNAAREQYNEQPRVKAVIPTDFGWDCPIDEYSQPEEAIMEQARMAALPGYATITTDGQWMSPGDMGWWGVSSDEPDEMLAYKREATSYIEGLPGAIYLIALDCHI